MAHRSGGPGIRTRLVLGLIAVVGSLALPLPGRASLMLTAEQQGQIDEDLARDRTWTAITTAAVAEGAAVEDIVEYLVETQLLAPGGTYDIVNSLVSTGFAPEQVIRGAVRGGGAIQPIFDGAWDAGTREEGLFSGARSAGVSDYQMREAYEKVVLGGSGNKAGSGGTGSGTGSGVSSASMSGRGDRR